MPGLYQPRQRIEQALYAIVMETYVQGCRHAPSTISSRPSASTRGAAAQR